MANVEFIPPIKGLSKGLPTDKAMPGTSEDMNNVRPAGFKKKIIIAQRPGLGKWSTDQVGAAEQPVVAIVTVASVI